MAGPEVVVCNPARQAANALKPVADRTGARGALLARAYRQAVLRTAALIGLYVAIALLPIGLAAAQDLPRRPWHQELSSGLAMAAFAMLLMEFLLAGRARRLSRWLGMDLTMRAHQFAGAAALALLAVHPLLYGAAYSEPQLWDVLRARGVVLTPEATVTGLLALLMLAVLVFFAAFRAQLRFSYETWRLTHVLGSLAVAGLGLRHALDTGRYAHDPASAAFWVVAAVLAAAAITKVYILDPLVAHLRRYRVTAVEREAERTWRMHLEPDAGRPLRFRGGQFVWLKLGRAFAHLTEHPFSIASGPAGSGRIELLIKEAGDFTSRIGRLTPGTPAFLDGPYGNFTLERREGDGIMLIAGGIGIAPVLSILHELAASGDRRPLKLVYGNRIAAQIVAKQDLEVLAKQLDLEVVQVLGEPTPDWSGLRGVLDAQTLAACLPRDRRERWLYFVCGPIEMIDAVELALDRAGVPLAQIVSERFSYAGGLMTPRERLTRMVLGGALGLILLGSLSLAWTP